MKKQDLNSIPFVGHHELVDNPQLIKVNSMKKKYVEQLPNAEYPDLLHKENFWEILGKTTAFIIARETNTNQIYKAHISTYIEYLRMHLKSEPEDIKMILRSIPQIFVD